VDAAVSRPGIPEKERQENVIKEGSRVKLNYTLKVDGDPIQSTAGKEPISYTQGSRQILPALERELEGLEVGDKKTVELPPEEGYGRRNPEAVRQVPRSLFPDPENIQLGRRVQAESEGGTFDASVADVGPDFVTLDLNHPLAGRTVVFEVEVVEVL